VSLADGASLPGVRALGPPPTFATRPRAVAVTAALPDALAVRLVTLDLILMVMLQRYALPLGGEAQISLVVLSHYGMLTVLLFARRATIDPTRLLLYAAFMILALLANLLPDRSFSVPSILLAAVTYAGLVPVLPIERASYRRILLNFQRVAAALCLLVFVQHGCQLAGLGMPTLEHLMPESMLYHEYVYIQPLYWSSPYFKPNAFFLLEASHTSQFFAMALILELAAFHRLRYVVLFGCGLVATFAGTGLLLMLLASPFLVARLRPAMIAACIVALPLVLGLAAASGWFEVVGKRLDEHERQGSSANARFVAPIEAVIETLESHDPEKILFGVGAGNMEKRPGVLWLAYSKVFIEYGSIVFLAWLAFFSYAVFRAPGLWVAAWIAAVQYHLLNGAFLVPLHVYLCWILAAGYRLPPLVPVTFAGRAGHRPKSACQAAVSVFN
jgi:hypothetical protein